MNKPTALILLVVLLALSVITFILTFILTIFAMFRGASLMEYLYNEYYKKWVYLTSIGSFGPGNVNPFRSIPYLYTSKDVKDAKLLMLKQRARFWTTLVGLGYGLFFIFLVLMMKIINYT